MKKTKAKYIIVALISASIILCTAYGLYIEFDSNIDTEAFQQNEKFTEFTLVNNRKIRHTESINKSGRGILFSNPIKMEDGSNLQVYFDTVRMAQNIGNTESTTGGTTGSNTETPTSGYDWTDASGWTYEVKGEANNSLYRLVFSNQSKKENHTYYVWMSNSASDMLNENEVITLDTTSQSAIGFTNDTMTYYIDKWLEKSGDIYFQIIDQYSAKDTDGTTKTVAKVVRKKAKLNRPEYKLTTIIKHHFFNETTATSVWAPSTTESTSERKVKVKIGKVTDVNILKAIKNSESGCLDKLLSYAKLVETFRDGLVLFHHKNSFILKIMLIW